MGIEPVVDAPSVGQNLVRAFVPVPCIVLKCIAARSYFAPYHLQLSTRGLILGGNHTPINVSAGAISVLQAWLWLVLGNDGRG
jgi:hypothetical protein